MLFHQLINSNLALFLLKCARDLTFHLSVNFSMLILLLSGETSGFFPPLIIFEIDENLRCVLEQRGDEIF